MRVIWLVSVFTLICLGFLAGGYFNKIKKSIATRMYFIIGFPEMAIL